MQKGKMFCRARSQLHVCLLVQNGTFSGTPVAQLDIVCPPYQVGSLVAASFGTEDSNGPWPALLNEYCDRTKCTALLHEKTVKELQEARAELASCQATIQCIRETSAFFKEQREEMLQKVNAKLRKANAELTKARKKIKIQREINQLA